MASNVSGKIAFVTGGASGIGAALATKLADEGVEVWIADRQIDAAQGLAQRLISSDAKAHAIELDVRSYPSFERAVAEVVQQSGRIDYLFNNAGIGVSGEVDSYTLDDWNDVFDVNLRGVVHGIQAVYPIMIGQHSGHIVNTASMAGLVASPGLGSYTATKHAVVAISKALRGGGRAPRRAGVGVLSGRDPDPDHDRWPVRTNEHKRRESSSRNSGSGCGRWHPKCSPSAPFVRCSGETQSLWCRVGGRHGGTWSGCRQRCRCDLQRYRSSAYAKWSPPPPDPLRVFVVRRTESHVAWGGPGG